MKHIKMIGLNAIAIKTASFIIGKAEVHDMKEKTDAVLFRKDEEKKKKKKKILHEKINEN